MEILANGLAQIDVKKSDLKILLDQRLKLLADKLYAFFEYYPRVKEGMYRADLEELQFEYLDDMHSEWDEIIEFFKIYRGFPEL